MRVVVLLILACALSATDIARFDVPKDKADAWSAAFPGVEWFPAVGDLKPITAIPEEVRGKWFHVAAIKGGKPVVEEPWAEVGKLSEQSLLYKLDPLEVVSVESDGKVTVTRRRDGTGEVIRSLGGGLVVVNLFNERKGVYAGAPSVYAVK